MVLSHPYLDLTQSIKEPLRCTCKRQQVKKRSRDSGIFLKSGLAVCYSFCPTESLDKEQSDRKGRMNFNSVELEALREEFILLSK